MSNITSLGFKLTDTVWVMGYQYVGGSVLKIGQIIELVSGGTKYEILSKPEYSIGKYRYQVKAA